MLGCPGLWPLKTERLGDSTERSLYPRSRPGLHSLVLCRAARVLGPLRLPDTW